MMVETKDPFPLIRWVTDVHPQFGRVVGLCDFRGRIIVACERAVLELEYNYITDEYRLTPR
jgi:hypothetical protein